VIEFKTIVPLKMEFQVHDKQEYDLVLDTKEEPRTKQCAVSLGRVLFLLKSKTFSIVTPLIEELLKSTVKPLIRNTSEEFFKCRLDNFSMSFILYYVNLSICENK